MKKYYITPKINLAKANIEYSVCTASIQNGDEFTPSGDIEDVTDPDDVEVGTKNRFYDGANDGWE